MDLFEFELRYLSFQGLSTRLHLNWEQDALLRMAQTSGEGGLVKKLTETTPIELQEITLETYTEYKKELVASYKEHTFWNFTIADYITRLEYELKVVKEMWYNTYFLIVQDFINRSKNNWISVGPGRWSAAWSLMARCTRITDVDPFPYGLLFERFLNPARISMPDIDVDFEDEKRYEVLKYVRHKYWEKNFSHIGTFMTLAAKAAFKDVARTMGMPFDKSNATTELITEKTIRDSIKARDELQTLYDTDDLIKKTLDAAMKLEWNIRQTGVHACGMIIAPGEITKFTSVQYPPTASWEEDQAVVSQFDYHALEDLGLLKMDFLWLRTLSLIKNTVKIVKARLNRLQEPVPEVLEEFLATMNLNVPLDDPLTYERVLQKGDTSGIFQFEWSGIRAFLVQLKPTNIDDVAAMSALYRPGPLEFIPNYIARKHGTEKLYYMAPELAQAIIQQYGNDVMEDEKRKLEEDLTPILGNTYGIAIYQEQLMFLVQSMAGFSLAEADMLRRGIGKKIKAEIERIKWVFVQKSGEFKQYKPETATFIYEKLIEPAASYSFNKSHAVAYGMISYQTAWLKAHYPIEFNAALLRSEEQNPDKLAQFISELQIQGYRVLPPHINESFTHVSAIDNTIRLWFLSIKWVWFDVGERIEQERELNGPYTWFEDFLTRNSGLTTKKTIESLAKAWAFHGMIDRKTVLENVQQIIDRSKVGGTDMQSWLFWWVMKPALSLKQAEPTGKMEKLLMEYDVFKTFVSGHPFDGLYQYCKKKFSLISAIKQTEQAGDVKILCFVKSIQRAKKKWFFIKVEDLSDEMEFFVKDYFDRQKFDILILEWFKAKSLRLSKITRTSLESLLEDATKAGKYNPEETIADVKAKRLQKDSPVPIAVTPTPEADPIPQWWSIAHEVPQEEEQEEIIPTTEPVEHKEDIWENHIETFTEEETASEESGEVSAEEDVHENGIEDAPFESTPPDIDIWPKPTILPLPSSLQTLQELKSIITSHPGNLTIQIGENTVSIDDEWYSLIKTLLNI